MTKRECLIHITSSGDSDPEGQELWVSGTCYENNPGEFHILYESREDIGDDTPATPDKLTKNLLKLTEDALEVVKYGPNSTKLLFGPDRSHDTVYRTPYGAMEMQFRTRHFEKQIKEREISISLRYEIHMNGSLLSENRMEISVKLEQ